MLHSSLFLSQTFLCTIIISVESYFFTWLHRIRHTLGSTPLDEWSARRRGLHFHKPQKLQGTNFHAPAGFEPVIPASEQPHTYSLDGAGTGIVCVWFFFRKIEPRVPLGIIARHVSPVMSCTLCDNVGNLLFWEFTCAPIYKRYFTAKQNEFGVYFSIFRRMKVSVHKFKCSFTMCVTKSVWSTLVLHEFCSVSNRSVSRKPFHVYVNCFPNLHDGFCGSCNLRLCHVKYAQRIRDDS